MNVTLKPGDRVRIKNTVTFGTVVEMVRVVAGDVRSQVIVEWDGHEGDLRPVSVSELEYVRPPPMSWARPAAALVFFVC